MKFYFNFVIGCVMLIALAGSNIYTQDVPTSLGPAPQGITYHAPFLGNYDQVGSRYWSQLSTTPTFQFGKAFLETCTITNIGTAFPITFPGGLVNKGGTIYTWNQSAPFQLWSIDTVTGVHTLVFNMTGVPQSNFTGMTWDGTTMYGVSTTISVSQIFTINMTTGVCTTLGTPSATCAAAIFLASRLGANYSLFSVDIVLDNLYKWNKTTGVPTLVGPIGGNANFGQDAQFDSRDGKLYWFAYTTGPALRSLDTTNGSNIQLCTFAAQATGIAVSEPGGSGPSCAQRQTFVDNNGFTKPILDNSTVRDTITVSTIGQLCTICDVNVRIDTVLHTWDADLAFVLTHGATNVNLITNRGGSGDNFLGTVLDDSASLPISSGTAPFTGSFRPEQPLSAYNTQNPNGTWILAITDGATADEGYLKQWAMVISYDCPTGGIQTVEIPFTYRLSQNYPNPFNPSTIIKYGLPKAGDTKLVVYDILGRVVTTLVNEYKSEGFYEVSFDGSNLASGIYFYSLESGTYKETKRMLLVK